MLKGTLLAAAFIGLTASAASASHQYRWVASSGGGNGPQQNRLVRVVDHDNVAPYALTGSEKPDRWQLRETHGGNGRAQYFARVSN